MDAHGSSLPELQPRIDRHASMVWFHWLTVLLVAASFALAWIRKDLDELEARAFWLDVHRTIGFLILALTVARLGSRLKLGAMSRRADLPRALWVASRATHSLIYAALLALPLLGWAQSSARARRFQIFDVPMPRLVAYDRDTAGVWGWWHEQVGWALLTLIVLHASAALYHHYVRHDDIVRAMLPRWVARPASNFKDAHRRPGRRGL